MRSEPGNPPGQALGRSHRRPHWLLGVTAKLKPLVKQQPKVKGHYGPPPDNRPNIFKTARNKRR